MILRGNVFSKILEMDTGITIVTPNDFKMDGTYKVVYLLHGACGNNGTWADYSMLPVYANHGKTIYVLPEVARSFYTDMKYGFKYFSYITEELPNICKTVFNISADREDTAIIGGSMGGYGALNCA
jgi:S-formylglutathione hydrolase FrmB